MKTIETWFLWLMIYSIIGWVYESTICSIGHRKLINRGFLNGPYCPIYGTGAVLVLLVLGRIQNPVLLFFAGALVTCSLEYLTSWLKTACVPRSPFTVTTRSETMPTNKIAQIQFNAASVSRSVRLLTNGCRTSTSTTENAPKTTAPIRHTRPPMLNFRFE